MDELSERLVRGALRVAKSFCTHLFGVHHCLLASLCQTTIVMCVTDLFIDRVFSKDCTAALLTGVRQKVSFRLPRGCVERGRLVVKAEI